MHAQFSALADAVPKMPQACDEMGEVVLVTAFCATKIVPARTDGHRVEVYTYNYSVCRLAEWLIQVCADVDRNEADAGRSQVDESQGSLASRWGMTSCSCIQQGYFCRFLTRSRRIIPFISYPHAER